MSRDKIPSVSLRLHGPKVDRAALDQAGEAMLALLSEVARATGAPDLKWELGEHKFVCDGCGLRQSLDASRDGWRHDDGNDYCPACEAGRGQ